MRLVAHSRVLTAVRLNFAIVWDNNMKHAGLVKLCNTGVKTTAESLAAKPWNSFQIHKNLPTTFTPNCPPAPVRSMRKSATATTRKPRLTIESWQYMFWRQSDMLQRGDVCLKGGNKPFWLWALFRFVLQFAFWDMFSTCLTAKDARVMFWWFCVIGQLLGWAVRGCVQQLQVSTHTKVTECFQTSSLKVMAGCVLVKFPC